MFKIKRLTIKTTKKLDLFTALFQNAQGIHIGVSLLSQKSFHHTLNNLSKIVNVVVQKLSMRLMNFGFRIIMWTDLSATNKSQAKRS